jgi:hypothetical protein
MRIALSALTLATFFKEEGKIDREYATMAAGYAAEAHRLANH